LQNVGGNKKIGSLAKNGHPHFHTRGDAHARSLPKLKELE